MRGQSSQEGQGVTVTTVPKSQQLSPTEVYFSFVFCVWRGCQREACCGHSGMQAGKAPSQPGFRHHERQTAHWHLKLPSHVTHPTAALVSVPEQGVQLRFTSKAVGSVPALTWGQNCLGAAVTKAGTRTPDPWSAAHCWVPCM